VVSTQICFIFTPNLGEDEPILIHNFGMGWNHQLTSIRILSRCCLLAYPSAVILKRNPPCWRVTFAENHMMWSNCSLQVWFSKGWWWWRRLGPLVFRSCLFALLGKIQLIVFKWVETIISMEISKHPFTKKRPFFAYATVSNRRNCGIVPPRFVV